MSGTSTLINLLANPPEASPQYWGQQMQNYNALRDYNANAAAQRIYQQGGVVDPATGVVNQGQFSARVAADPDASWAYARLTQQQGQAQQAQADAQNQTVAGHLAQLKIMNGEMSDLLQSGQPVTADQIHTRLNSLGKEGILTTPVMNGINADLNSQPPGTDLTGWLRNHMATNLSATEQLQNVTSQPQTQNLGDRTVVVEGNPNRPGGNRVGTSYVPGLSPSEQADMVTVNYSDGSQRQMPRVQALKLFGANYASQVIPGSAPQAGQPATPANGGRYTPPGAPQGGAGGGGGAGGANGGAPAPAPGSGPSASGGAPGAPQQSPQGQPNAAGGTPVAGQPGMFAYPGGKVGGAPDANGGVRYSDGSYGTPGGGFRAPAQPPAATTGTGAGDSGPYMVGDSLANGVQTAGKFDGNTKVGRSPQQVLQTMTDPNNQLPMQGRDVVISSGAANNLSQAGYLQQQIDAANKAGAKSVTVMGTADPVTNRQLQSIATQAGARFVPIGQTGPDGVHPADYRPLVSAVRPPAPAATTTTGQPPAATTTAAQPGPIPGLTVPGAGPAAEVAARGSAEDQLAFRRDLPAAQGRIFAGQQALSALSDAKTGTGTIPLQTVNGIINSYAPDALKAWIPGYDPNMAVNRDLAEKYMTQLTMGRASQFGPSTDARLAAAFTGSANTHIQQLAAQDVLKVGIGLDRMNQAMGDDMQNQNVAPQDFASWRQNWVRTHDPRAYVVDSMSPEQRANLQKMLKEGSPQQRDIFAQTYHQAVGGGYVPSVIPNPRASAQAGG